MSLIFGVASRGDAAIPRDWLPAAKHAVEAWPAHRSQEWAEPRLAAFCKQVDTTPWMRHSPPLVMDDRAVVLFDGRLDNRSEVADRIGLDGLDAVSDAQLVLVAWNTLGEALPRNLVGDFAIAIYLRDTRELVVIRDHLGIRPMFLCCTAEFMAFSTSMPPLLALPFCDRRWNGQWVVDFLEEVKPDAEYTGFMGIRAMPPAHLVRIAPNGENRLRYWSLKPEARVLDIGPDEAVAQTADLFERAVADRLVTGGGRLACELSGGLDSSSIAVTASRQLAERGEQLIGVTQALEPEFKTRYGTLSEQGFADAVYNHCPQIERLDVYNRTGSLLDMLAQTVARHGAPPRNDFNGMASQAPELLAARDARVLLSGFGGDQVFTASAGGLAESLLTERDWHTVLRLLWRGGGRKRMLATILGNLPLAGALMPGRSDRTRLSPHLASATARAAAGYPQRASLHLPPAHSGTMQQRDAYNLSRPVMAYRLQDSQVGAGARGVEYRYPMLDIRLIGFVHRLPAAFRNGPGETRRLIRRVAGDFLPEMVRDRRDKTGLTVPGVFVNVIQHAQELRDHVVAMRSDALLLHYAEYGEVLAALDATLEMGEFPKMASIMGGNLAFRRANHGQVLRLALLGLWRQAATGEAVAVGEIQPNQTE